MEDEIAYRVALIHEVHHRVKNNLQTIISLIGLEAVHTKDEKSKSFCKDHYQSCAQHEYHL